MWFLEGLFYALTEWAVNWAPRPVRIGCTVLLIVVAIALLTLIFWLPR